MGSTSEQGRVDMSRKDSIENKVLKGIYPSRDVLERYYIIENHSQNDTADYFHVTRFIIQKLCIFYGIVKDPSQRDELNMQKNRNNPRSIVNKIQAGEYPCKEDFITYYIEGNHSRASTAEFFKISEAAVTDLSKHWDVHKNQAQITNTCKETCKSRYGCESNLQTEETKQKIKETCLRKYGVSYGCQSDLAKEKRKATFNKKYGVDHVLQNKDIIEKMHKTTKEKYGVEWPCQIDSCRNSLHGPNSKPNKAFEQKLIDQKLDVTREFPLGAYSFDFKVNDVLLEINPWFTHQSSFDNKFAKKEKDYHAKKTCVAAENNFHCIHIFDWDDQDKIISCFLVDKEKCYARKCSVREVSTSEEIDFLRTYHLQGYIKSDICIGLYLGDKLVQLMSFGKPRYNTKYEYELLRLCSSMQVIGGAQKLFNHFICEYTPNNIISYCDLSKFNGNVYKDLGFKLLRTSISKHWYSPKLKKHYTDNLVRQQGFDRLLGNIYETYGKGTSNDALMLEHGFVEIYDAGQATYVYNRTND